MSRDWNLSASKIKSFKTCPKQVWFRYVSDEERDGSNEYTRMGSRVHETLDAFLGSDPPREDQDAMASTLVTMYDGMGDEYPLPDKQLKQGRKCLKAAAKYLAKRSDVSLRGIERRTEFHADELGEDFTAILDVATEGPNEIWDWKTGRIRDDTDVDETIQGAVYMAAYGVEYGEPPEMVRFVYLKEREVRSFEPSDDEWMRMLQYAKALLSSVKHDDYPAKTGDHCYWCAYSDICPATASSLNTVSWRDFRTV